MIGTIIGLVNLLGNLSNPESLGSGMALALLTTLYGVFAANIVFGPIANKRQLLSSLETTASDLILEGLLTVRASGTCQGLIAGVGQVVV
jgi:chemotaxis protein MotA